MSEPASSRLRVNSEPHPPFHTLFARIHGQRGFHLSKDSLVVIFTKASRLNVYQFIQCGKTQPAAFLDACQLLKVTKTLGLNMLPWTEITKYFIHQNICLRSSKILLLGIPHDRNMTDLGVNQSKKRK